MKCSLNVFPFKASTDHSGVPSVPSHCWLQAFLCRLQSNRSKLPRKNSFVLPSGMFHLLVHLSAMGPGSHSSPRRSPAPDTRRAACRAPSRRGGTVTAGGSARFGSARLGSARPSSALIGPTEPCRPFSRLGWLSRLPFKLVPAL